MYCIYKATSKTTGKSYIGKTKNFENRKKEHISGKEDHIFSRAIKKYGEEDFVWEILEDNIPDNQKASEREIYWIKRYNTYFKSRNSRGYNMTRGGDGGTMWNIRKIAIYDLQGNLLDVCDSITEFCDKYNITSTSLVSQSISRKGSCHGFIVREVGDIEPPTKIEPYHKESHRKKRICQLSLDGELIKIYDKITDACSEGFRRSGILGCANGRYKQSLGFQWCYLPDLERKLGSKVSPIISFKDDKILKVSLDGYVISEYESCAEASRQNGNVNYKTISKAVNSEGHKAFGFLWYKKSQFDMVIPR